MLDIKDYIKEPSRPFSCERKLEVIKTLWLSNKNFSRRSYDFLDEQSKTIKPFLKQSKTGIKGLFNDQDQGHPCVAFMYFPEDYIKPVFPRNLPWKELPVICEPYYQMGNENVYPAWIEENRFETDGTIIPLADVKDKLERLIISYQDNESRNKLVHDAYVMLKIMGVKKLPVTLLHQGIKKELSVELAQEIYENFYRVERAQYIYRLNASILLERIFNKLTLGWDVGIEIKREWVRKQTEGFSLDSQAILSLRSLEIFEDKCKAQQIVKWHNTVLAAGFSLSNGFSIDQDNYIIQTLENKISIQQRFLEFMQDYGDSSEKKLIDTIKNSRCFIITKGGVVENFNTNTVYLPLPVPHKAEDLKYASLDFKVFTHITKEMREHYIEGLTLRLSEAQNLFDLSNKSFDLIKQQISLDGNDEKKELWIDYGYFKTLFGYQACDKPTLWRGVSKEYVGLEHKSVQTFIFQSGFAEGVSFRIENDCSVKSGTVQLISSLGKNLLSMIPKGFHNPDLPIKIKSLELDSAAVSQIDRAMMQSFRALKRAVANLPASIE